MSLYNLQQEDRAILQSILDNHSPTAEDILKIVYLSDESKKWRLYRKLKRLRDEHFIEAKRLEELKGASSPQYFVLRAKGARVLGLEHVPPSHYRYVRKDFHIFRQIKLHLDTLAQKHRWKLLKENQECRTALAQYFRSIAMQRGNTPAPDYIYLDSVPQKITPDMVLVTARETIIVIVSYPSARSEAFRKKLEKYSAIIYNLRFIVINPFEEQTRLFQDVLVREENEAGRRYRQQFLILTANQTDNIISWLRTS